VLVEPPRARPAVGPRQGLTAAISALRVQRAPALSTVRIAALAAATVLAIASKGDIAVLAAALAITAGAWHSTVAVALGLVAASMRVGASSMRAIAGAQSVLGPAGWNGKVLAVAATWLAALAIVTAARSVLRFDGRWSSVLVGLPFGASAAAIAAGPGPGGALAIRVVATALAALAATGVVRVRVRPSADRLVAIAAPVLGAAAVVLGVLAR
jgi:hypothetical protein